MTSSQADATRLVRYGLAVTATPAREDEYRDLVGRSLADPAFRAQTEQAAAALDLRIAAIDPTVGIVVVPTRDSVFTPTWTWLREQAKVDPTAANRMIVGLLLVGVAALCYPTAASLTDPALRRFTTNDVDALLRRHGKLLAEAEDQGEGEPPAAWQAYAARKSIDTGPSGQRTRNCTIAIAERVCDLLAAQRLLLRSDDGGQVAYRSTDRFRHLVRMHAATEAYRALMDVDVTSGAGHATPTDEGEPGQVVS